MNATIKINGLQMLLIIKPGNTEITTYGKTNIPILQKKENGGRMYGAREKAEHIILYFGVGCRI